MNPPNLAALLTGDTEAWDEAFRWLWPTVFAVAQLKLQPFLPDEIEDVAIEALEELVAKVREIKSVEERIATARHFRVFPGEGVHSEALASLVSKLHELGYRGDYSFEVFNDDYQQMPLPTVAQRAWRSAQWLGEDVLRRSVPLPNQIRLKR